MLKKISFALAFFLLLGTGAINATPAHAGFFKKLKRSVKKRVRKLKGSVKKHVKLLKTKPYCIGVLSSVNGNQMISAIKLLKRRGIVKSRGQCLNISWLASQVAGHVDRRLGPLARIYGKCACYRAF